MSKPSPDQLRTAIPAFAAGHPEVAETLEQARLPFYCVNCYRKRETTYITPNFGPFCDDCLTELASSAPAPVTPPIDKRKAGLYRKFEVRRTDGSDGPGGKHEGCNYFVLDLTHDPHAMPALSAYAASCRKDYPTLASQLDEVVNGNPYMPVLTEMAPAPRWLKPEEASAPVTVPADKQEQLWCVACAKDAHEQCLGGVCQCVHLVNVCVDNLRERAEAILDRLLEHDDGRCSCVTLQDCDGVRLRELEAALASSGAPNLRAQATVDGIGPEVGSTAWSEAQADTKKRESMPADVLAAEIEAILDVAAEQLVAGAAPPASPITAEQITLRWFTERQHRTRDGYLQVQGFRTEAEARALEAQWAGSQGVRVWELYEPPASPAPSAPPQEPTT